MVSAHEILRLLQVVNGEMQVSRTSLWLDPRRRKDLAFVSHAHSDHAVKHAKVVVSKNCLPLYRERTGETDAIAKDYNAPFSVDDVRVTLLPAGHILGSSQILIERDGLSLLYSGDFKLRDSATAEKIETRHADILIVESTYGLPHYRFPCREEVIAQLKQFLDETLRLRRTPVLYVYSLGKAQETMRIVNDLGYESWVHETIWRIAKLYVQQGVALGRFRRFSPQDWNAARAARPRAILVPPQLRKWEGLNAIGPKRTAFLSGFALDKRTMYIYRADAYIPLSDHADFTEWLEYIRRVNPRVVITTHGPDEARTHLVREGFRAVSLASAGQGLLFEAP